MNNTPIIFQISSEVNSGSVGRIAEQIGEKVLEKGWDSYIAFARDNQPSKSKTIRIGTKLDITKHGILTRLTDMHGYGSKKATLELIEKIKEINPDIIHLHHLHGYFINFEILFNFLITAQTPVVWTFHDCWSFTGHCTHYEFVGCNKWMNGCYDCEQKREYPASLLVDRSKKNYLEKKELFNSVEQMLIVPVSNWLGNEVKKSFLKDIRVDVIQNGIDVDKFNIQENKVKQQFDIENKFLILGVASPWSHRKGLQYFFELSKLLTDDYKILLVGLSSSQIKELPTNIIGLERTESVLKLAELYSAADVFFNPTLEEALGLTNLEAQACGTPVITFDSGGSPETINSETGIVVPKGNIEDILEAIYEIRQKGKNSFTSNCRKRVVENFNKENKFTEYINLYSQMLFENEI